MSCQLHVAAPIVLPDTDFAWGLHTGRSAAEAEVKLLGCMGVAHEETERLAESVLKRIAQVEAWIDEDLGDFRSFGLDSPKSRLKNTAALDKLRRA